jgi:hypothetical protein
MAPMIEFKFVGYQRVENKLRLLAAEHPEVYEDTLTRWAGTMRSKLKSRPYPPPRAGQKYVRTGRLANSWRVEKVGPGRVTIANSAQSKGRYYGPYVVGDGAGKEQAWMHEDRWWLAADVVKEDTAELTQQMARELTSFWNGIG